MSRQEVQLLDLLKHMHAMCSVRGDEIRALVPILANKALDAGYWSEAFRAFLYDGDVTVDDMRIAISSHIQELGGTVELDQETAELIEVTYYLRRIVQPGEDALEVAHYLLVDLNYEWAIDGGPANLHLHDLAMDYYQWCYDYAEWMQGHEFAEKKRETEVMVKKLAQAWLDQYAVPNPFDRL